MISCFLRERSTNEVDRQEEPAKWETTTLLARSMDNLKQYE